MDSVQHIHISLFSEHWDQHLSCLGAEEKAGITCLDWLVMLCSAPEAVGLLCCKGTLLAHGQLLPQVILFPTACTGAWVIPDQEQDVMFPFVELHKVPLVPFPSPVLFPLGDSAPATPPALCHLQTSLSSEELAPIFFIATHGRI